MNWTEKQIMAARAITLIKNNMAPLCDSCGVNADRPNCFMGGGCGRHEQENVIAYKKVISSLEKSANFTKGFDNNWKIHMPLHLYVDFTKNEIDLLYDLVDSGGSLSSRNMDNRFDSLSTKGAVYYSNVNNMWSVTLTPKGRDLYNYSINKE